MTTHAHHAAAAMERAERPFDGASDAHPHPRLLSDTSLSRPIAAPPAERDVSADLLLLLIDLGRDLIRAQRGMRERERIRPQGIAERVGDLAARLVLDEPDEDVEQFAVDCCLALADAALFLGSVGRTDSAHRASTMRSRLSRRTPAA